MTPEKQELGCMSSGIMDIWEILLDCERDDGITVNVRGSIRTEN